MGNEEQRRGRQLYALHWWIMIKILFCLILLIASPCFAVDYSWYFSESTGHDTEGDGTQETPWKTINKINSQILTMTEGTDSATIYLKRGDTWTGALSTAWINVRKSNVTITAYGSGDKPILDGAGVTPEGVTGGDIPYGYFIKVGNGTSATVTNVHVSNIRITNGYPGGGIQFSGADSTYNATGPGSVTNCELYDLGWSAIALYKIGNYGGSANAIKLENNSITTINEYCRVNAWTMGWPQAIQGNMSGSTYGHEARYNVISDVYGEGIGAQGFSVIEYNDISSTKAPGIYVSNGSGNSPDITTAVRYNIVWRNSSDSYTLSSGIRVDDEGSSGDNAGYSVEVYGNVVAGDFYSGIDVRNGAGTSNWDSVKVYNNTIIDCDRNLVVSKPQFFTVLDIRNNASIIHSDAASAAVHLSVWNATSYSELTTIGPNLWSGDGYASETDLPADWRDGANVFGSASLGKTSGWRSITAVPGLSDFTPVASSDMIQNANAADLGASYDDYVNNDGSAIQAWEGLPATEDFPTATQAASWTFGAILTEPPQGEPETGNTGLRINSNAGKLLRHSSGGVFKWQ